MKKITLFLLILITSFSCYPLTNLITGKQSELYTISREEIRSLYLMKRKRTYEGEVVYLFQFPRESKLHKDFIYENLYMSIESYDRELEKTINAGLAKPIKIIKNSTEMINSVASTPNGVGYIDKDTLIIHSKEHNVKIYRITD